MQKSTIIFILLVLCFTNPAAADFELSGKLERGENTYLSNQDLLSENVVDYYSYDNFWLKLKKKLDYPNYYYFKVKYYEKLYDEESTYDNRSLDLTGNYTQEFNEIFRNKFKFKLKDKRYINNRDNSYTSYSFGYQFRHTVNEKNQYSLDLKKKEYSYVNEYRKNYLINTYKINWQRDISDKFEIELGYQLKNKEYQYSTDSNDRVVQKYSIDFSYDL
ncbi:MAG TPA: hypothetical protein VKN64_11030 [Halanaerobiales bacterium]|nr:hypothetical protein [Halanaerobiales bacterium]